MNTNGFGIFLVAVLLLVFGKLTYDKRLTLAAKPKVRIFEFVYTAKVKDIPKSSKKVDIWLPYPPSTENQRISNVEVKSSYPWKLNKDPEYGNSIVYLPINEPKTSTLNVQMRFRVERSELLRKNVRAREARSDTQEVLVGLERWLASDTMVPIDERVKQRAMAAVNGNSKTDFEKARSIYDYSVSTLKYDKTGTGWGRGDISYACDVKKGNCTDFHAVFIGFCRALGIPAKFEIGFPLPETRGQGQISGYHCWAHFFNQGYGWVPVDCSEASKDPSKREYYWGALDENRILFSIGRDITLDPPQKGEKLNFFVYPYVEIDGQNFSNVERSFYFRDVPQ